VKGVNEMRIDKGFRTEPAWALQKGGRGSDTVSDSFLRYVVEAQEGLWCVWRLNSRKEACAKFALVQNKTKKQKLPVELHTRLNELWAMRR
jgi:hypothetical protein